MDRLVVERAVRWGDCDPAGIVYTPRVFDFATEAVEAWFREVAGLDWAGLVRGGRGAPTVHASCDYLRPMAPGLAFRVCVLLEKVGTSSLTFRLLGKDADGELYFDAKIVSVFTDFTAGRSETIPDAVRERAEAYERACRDHA